MTRYCSQCGSEIEEGADFCYSCGAMANTAFDMDDRGNLKPASDEATRICPACGYSNPFKQEKCLGCGADMPPVEEVRVPKALDASDFVKMAFGIIPGCLGVCGLGHILYHHYSRGLMFLVISLIILYIEISLGFTTSSTKMLIIRIIGFAVFLKSAIDLLGIAYFPDPPKGGE